ncbi:DUF2637 domain-containing protein [Streptomyces cacaoi]|uniref:DUF2637 domain-containing protein n=1 Tax=Streptomyces cacaoi TaxID=1898 RepID=UPI0011F2AD09|nr:DUF2637 domain-containing protein [Streptomyces cacaoi]
MTRTLAGAALVGMIPVTGVGFAASYSTLRDAALGAGFADWLAPWVPIGIDGAIIAFLAMELFMVARGTPWPLMRFAAHGMAASTVLLNATAGTGSSFSDAPVDAFWHGLMPLLFVAGVEGARRLLLHIVRREKGLQADSIPAHRWLLAPWPTAKLYRRMRLADVRSYPEMVQREQDLAGYRVWLTQQHGGSLSGASEIERLPMTLAGRGFTVDEALALPERWQAEQERREREKAERLRKEELRRARQAKEDRLREIRDKAELAAAEHTTEADVASAEAQAESARAQAERVRLQAERQLQAQAEAEETAEAAAARRRAAEENKRAAAAEAEAKRQIAEARKAEREAQALADIEETAEMAAARRRAAEENKRAAEIEAETAAQQAEVERIRRQSEREVQALADIEETAEMAAARRRAAEEAQAAAAAEAEAKRQIAEAKEAERVAEKAEAEAKRQKAEAKEAEAAEAQAAARAAEARRQAEMAQAQAEAQAAEMRRQAAVIEAQAVAAEDYARLSPRERRARRVARMLWEAGDSPEGVQLTDIEEELGCSRTTASELRQEAVGLLQSGYDPASAYTPN